ncbi:MAG: GNAT family N-acetyltransferase [Pseudonocardia sp.]
MAADGPFLVEMLAEAAYWTELGLAGPRAVLDVSELARYVAGWPRPGDLGVVAQAGGEPVGAAWLRLFTADEPAFGFVAADVPELATGVVAGWRGRGVGRALLRELARAATAEGVAAISLSVRRTNPAARLYCAEGYRVVGGEGESDTMLKDLMSRHRG